MMINVTLGLLAFMAVCASSVPMFNRKEEYLRELAAIDRNGEWNQPHNNIGDQLFGSDGRNLEEPHSGRNFVITIDNNNLLRKLIGNDEDTLLFSVLGDDSYGDNFEDRRSLQAGHKKDSNDLSADILRKRTLEGVEKHALDSIGGGALLGKRALDSIGGGALLGKRALDSIGGGALLGKRALDSIGGGALLGKRALDSIGGGALLGKRSLDSIGGGALLGKRALQSMSGEDLLRKRTIESIAEGALLRKRALDSIGGGALLGKRSLDSIGGGALLGKRASETTFEDN